MKMKLAAERRTSWSLYSPVVTVRTADLTFTVLRSGHTRTIFMRFVWISEQTAIISLYSINCFYIRDGECLLRGTD